MQGGFDIDIAVGSGQAQCGGASQDAAREVDASFVRDVFQVTRRYAQVAAGIDAAADGRSLSQLVHRGFNRIAHEATAGVLMRFIDAIGGAASADVDVVAGCDGCQVQCLAGLDFTAITHIATGGQRQIAIGRDHAAAGVGKVARQCKRHVTFGWQLAIISQAGGIDEFVLAWDQDAAGVENGASFTSTPGLLTYESNHSMRELDRWQQTNSSRS